LDMRRTARTISSTVRRGRKLAPLEDNRSITSPAMVTLGLRAPADARSQFQRFPGACFGGKSFVRPTEVPPGPHKASRMFWRCLERVARGRLLCRIAIGSLEAEDRLAMTYAMRKWRHQHTGSLISETSIRNDIRARSIQGDLRRADHDHLSGVNAHRVIRDAEITGARRERRPGT